MLISANLNVKKNFVTKHSKVLFSFQKAYTKLPHLTLELTRTKFPTPTHNTVQTAPDSLLRFTDSKFVPGNQIFIFTNFYCANNKKKQTPIRLPIHTLPLPWRGWQGHAGKTNKRRNKKRNFHVNFRYFFMGARELRSLHFRVSE